MHIRQLQLTNIRCFEDISLDFERNGQPRMWTVIAGPNGTGKSTLLKAIASFFGHHPVRGSEWLPGAAVRFGAEHGRVAGRVQMQRLIPSGALPHDLAVNIPVVRAGHSIVGMLPGEVPIAGDLMVGLGPVRLGPPPTIETGLAMPTFDQRAWAGSLAPLYGWPARRLSDLYNWVRWEDYIRLKAEHSEAHHRPSAIGALSKAINILFDGLAEYREVDTRGHILFDTPDGVVPLEELADGLRSVFVIVAELLLRLDAAFPESKAPVKEPAVCLVDELDAHLHPRLQRTVVPALRKLFPNVQFVVTTHSPYVVGSAEHGEVVVMRREGTSVVVDTDVPDVAGWRADQIATSPIFGLDTTRDLRGEAALRTERALLPKPELTKSEQARLAKAKGVLDRADGPMTAMVRQLLVPHAATSPKRLAKKKRKAS